MAATAAAMIYCCFSSTTLQDNNKQKRATTDHLALNWATTNQTRYVSLRSGWFILSFFHSFIHSRSEWVSEWNDRIVVSAKQASNQFRIESKRTPSNHSINQSIMLSLGPQPSIDPVWIEYIGRDRLYRSQGSIVFGRSGWVCVEVRTRRDGRTLCYVMLWCRHKGTVDDSTRLDSSHSYYSVTLHDMTWHDMTLAPILHNYLELTATDPDRKRQRSGMLLTCEIHHR